MKKYKNNFIITTFIFILIITIIYTSISNSITAKSIKIASKNLVKSGLIYNDDNTYTDIFNTILKLTPLTEEQVLKLMKLDYVENELTNIVDTIYEYNLTNNENIKYSKEKIIELTSNNIEKVCKDIDYPLTKEDKEKAIKYTKKNTDYIINTIYQTNIGNWNKID